MKQNKILWVLVMGIMLAGCAAQRKAAAPTTISAQGAVVPATETAQTVTAQPIPMPALEEEPKLLSGRVGEAVFCEGIKDRIPQRVGDTFDASVGKVYFFTRVTGARQPTSITHVWYYNEKKMAEVPLDVRSDNWRTWSSKRIEPAWKGAWAVKVLDENGDVLITKNFTIR